MKTRRWSLRKMLIVAALLDSAFYWSLRLVNGGPLGWPAALAIGIAVAGAVGSYGMGKP